MTTHASPSHRGAQAASSGTSSTPASGEKLIQPNAKSQYEVTTGDLPLSCPMPGMQLWNSHPRVFLPIERTGWAKCPYCSAEYTLRRGPAAD